MEFYTSGPHAVRGRDRFGRFIIKLHGTCGHCSKHGIVIQYQQRPDFDDYVASAPSLILKPGVRQLGIQCGCYGAAHRQEAHIREHK